MTPKEVLALIRQYDVKTVDFRFMDFPGVWQHFAVPSPHLTEETFEDGVGFDGSSVVGWRAINEADLLVVPQSETALLDPFASQPTLTMICNIHDPITRQDYTRDPRNIARKAFSYAQSSGLIDEVRFAPGLEFFIFDSVQYEQSHHRAFYQVDSEEGGWNSGQGRSLDGGPNLGYKPRVHLGYFPCPPIDSMADLRTEMTEHMEQCRIEAKAHFHEASSAGQCEIALGAASLVEGADQVMLARSIIRNVARKAGKTATFMPKPIFGDNGSGMHVSMSFWRDDRPLLAGHHYASLSNLGLYAIGGIIKHAAALCAFANPTTNSYKRLVPGFEAPTKIAYSRRNRSAILRIPIYSPSETERRLEYRCPDSAANPYLLYSAMVMAALDGIQTKINPGEPLDKDIYDLQPEELEDVPGTPRRLEESLIALERDHEFLLRGDVFTTDVIDTWIWYKRTQEVEAIRGRPHPYEFEMYYDI